MNEMSYKDRAREEKLPIPYEIYKGIKGKNGVLRVKPLPAYSSDKYEEGNIFLEMAPTKGENIYDWDKKIVISLKSNDLSKIVLYLSAPGHPLFKDGKLNIYHDNNGDVKVLQVYKDPNKYNFFFQLTHTKDNQEISKAFVPVGPDEAIVLKTLFTHCIPMFFSWSTEDSRPVMSKLDKLIDRLGQLINSK